MKKAAAKSKPAAVRTRTRSSSAQSSAASGSGYQAAIASRFRSWLGNHGIHSEEMYLDELGRERLQSVLMWLARNNSICKSIFRVKKTAIVGAGMLVQPQTADPKYNDAVEELWAEFEKNPEPTGRMDLTEILKWQMAYVPLFGGDGFISLLENGQIQPIEGHQCGNAWKAYTLNEVSPMQNGVEIDANGKPVAYHIGKRVMGLLQDTKPYPVQWTIQVGIRERVDQYRLIMQLATAVPEILDLSEYDLAVLLRAKAAAMMGVIVETPTPHLRGGGALSNKDGDERGDLKEMMPGRYTYMRPGEKATIMNPAVTDPGASIHILTHLRRIGSTVGMPAEVILMDLGSTSFSASLALQMHAGEAIKEEQNNGLRPWRDVIYKWKINKWLAEGKLNLPKGGGDPYAVKIALRTMPWINKKDELASDQGYSNMGVFTRSDICARFNLDPTEQANARAKDIVELSKLSDTVNKQLPAGQPLTTWRDFSDTASRSVSIKDTETGPALEDKKDKSK